VSIVRVTEVDPQLGLAAVGIDQRLGERRAGHQVQALALRVAPAEEGIDHGQGMTAAVVELGHAVQLTVTDLLFHLV